MNHNDKTKHPGNYAVIAPYQQNWGVIIGVGIVVLLMLVMVINLSTYKAKPTKPATDLTTVNSSWVQIGRVAGLVTSLSVGGWLLWRLLRQRQTSDRTYLNTYLQQAVSYTRQIESLLRAGTNGHEQQLLTQIHTWQQTIEAMAQTLTNLGQNDHIIQRDLDHLPGTIADLERQLTVETNSLLRTDLEQMLLQRQNQRLSLEQLQTTRRRAEIQIERTIAVLGTIYSQLLTYRSTFHVVDYQHLADNVAEEVQYLQDYLEALQEVKGSRLSHN